MSDKKIDARILRSRQLLQAAIIDLIREKGYEQITVQDLCTRANLNRSTFYLHYKDKYDLIICTTQSVLDELRSCVTQAPLVDPENEPHPGMVQLFEHIARHESFYSVMLGEQGYQRFDHSMMQIMRESYTDMLDPIRPEAEQWEVPFEFFINYITSAHFGVIKWWLTTDMEYSTKYMATHLTRLTKSTMQDLAQSKAR